LFRGACVCSLAIVKKAKAAAIEKRFKKTAARRRQAAVLDLAQTLEWNADHNYKKERSRRTR
jgi:hypothetical protein